MKLLAKVALVGLLGGAGATAIYADSDGGAGGSVTAPTAQVRVTISFSEMVTRAKATRDQVSLDYQHVLHLQAMARKEKDIIKLNCVNDKLVQMKPLMNITERAASELEGAAGNDDLRYSAYDEVTRAGEDVRRMREEADQCAGEPTLSTESTNGWTHPEVPDDPFANPFGDYIEPPGYASPFN